MPVSGTLGECVTRLSWFEPIQARDKQYIWFYEFGFDFAEIFDQEKSDSAESNLGLVNLHFLYFKLFPLDVSVNS